MTHPFRKLEIKTYTPDDEGEPHIAYIGGVGKSAMHFLGESRDEAYAKAQKFKWDSIEQHEEALIARKQAAKERKAKAK